MCACEKWIIKMNRFCGGSGCRRTVKSSKCAHYLAKRTIKRWSRSAEQQINCFAVTRPLLFVHCFFIATVANLASPLTVIKILLSAAFSCNRFALFLFLAGICNVEMCPFFGWNRNSWGKCWTGMNWANILQRERAHPSNSDCTSHIVVFFVTMINENKNIENVSFSFPTCNSSTCGKTSLSFS